MLRYVVVLVAAALLQACTFNDQPFVMPTAAGRALSATAVFAVGPTNLDDANHSPLGDAVAQITAVDGVDTTCWQTGCPVWVRVAPGPHTFTITHRVLNNGIYSYLIGTAAVSVPDMKAEHVYVAKFIVEPDGRDFKAVPVDLGKGSNYGFTVRGKHRHAQF